MSGTPPSAQDSVRHNASPLRRRLISRSGSSSPALIENDDDAERRELRREAEFEICQHETTLTSEKQNSEGNILADLTSQQLAEHYANCIKLSTENKINAKNAFSLQLIDYMTMMLKIKDSKMDNLQVASCTLDASTKIYAYRVDSVYTDVLKLAGGLAGGSRKKQTEENKEDEGIGEEPAEGAASAHIKKRRKPKSTVATNLASINEKPDLNYDLDPFFMHSAGSLNDCQPGECHFLTGLKICSNYSLALDSCLPYWSKGTRSEFADVKVLLPAIPDLRNKKICRAFDAFTFSNWSLEEEDSLTSGAAGGLPPVDDDYVFDVNAEPEPIPDPKTTDMEPENFEIAGVDDDQDSEDEEEVTQTCQIKPAHPVAIVDLKQHLSLTPREYSYFRAGAMDLFLGPKHWKPKPYNNRGTSTEGQNKDGSAATAIVKQKYQKKAIELKFNNLEEVLIKTETSAGCAARLKKLTVMKWGTEQILDIKEFYDMSQFSQLALHRLLVVNFATYDGDDETEVDAPAYDYDNANDAEYCPSVIEDSSDESCEEPVETDGVQLQDVHNATTEVPKVDEFAGDNLVAPPIKVSRVFIPYAMQAKKMDMKKLKHCIWSLITESDSTEAPAESNVRMEEPKKFSTMYSQLPSKLSAKLAENLTPHLAICALLHLASENNLKLSDEEDLGDLTITQF